MMQNAVPMDPPVPQRRNLVKSCVAIMVSILCVLYLLNLDCGLVELIPDNLPVIGNLDEVAVTILLLNCLAYFGLDFTHLIKGFQRSAKNITPERESPR